MSGMGERQRMLGNTIMPSTGNAYLVYLYRKLTQPFTLHIFLPYVVVVRFTPTLLCPTRADYRTPDSLINHAMAVEEYGLCCDAFTMSSTPNQQRYFEKLCTFTRTNTN